MSQATKTSNIQDHQRRASELFRENPHITLEGFCARMQQDFQDCNDPQQLEHYYRKAKSDHRLVDQIREIRDLCDGILKQQGAQSQKTV